MLLDFNISKSNTIKTQKSSFKIVVDLITSLPWRMQVLNCRQNCMAYQMKIVFVMIQVYIFKVCDLLRDQMIYF